MKYKIVHTTTYTYETPVRVCNNLVLLRPRESPQVTCGRHRLRIHPTPLVLHERKDFFGNHVHAFAIEQSHRELKVVANSQVDVQVIERPTAEEAYPTWAEVAKLVSGRLDPLWLKSIPFVYNSRRVKRSSEYEDYTRAAFGDQTSVFHAVWQLTQKIHDDFQYDTNATMVDTPAEEAFRLRRGVCQDFAHIQIACLRSVGLPARYVSGYLRTIPPPGRPRLVGADQSHAWLSVYCGHPIGWIDFDPTNRCVCTTDHIPIAWGRDYQDVVPLRGVFLGGGKHVLTVSVDVAAV